MTSTRSSRAARAWKSGSWPPTRASPPTAGRRTVASCSITASTRRRTPTSGFCRWWATAKPSVFLKTPFREVWGRFSPDGRWVAYQSNESGRPEIYVRPFVPPGAAGAAAAAAGGQWQVSTAGGIFPVWRPDGKELYYLNPAGAMMAAPITVTGTTLAPGAPVVLFPTRIWRWRRGRAAGSAIRRGPRWTLPDQHGTGERRPRRSRC